MLGRGFHTYINNASFSSPTDMGSHNPPPFEAQCFCWHSFPSPIDSLLQSMWDSPIHPHSRLHCLMFDFDTLCNNPSPPLTNIVLFELSLPSFFPQGFRMYLLGRDFYTLKRNASFPSSIDVRSHISLPYGIQNCYI